MAFPVSSADESRVRAWPNLPSREVPSIKPTTRPRKEAYSALSFWGVGGRREKVPAFTVLIAGVFAIHLWIFRARKTNKTGSDRQACTYYLTPAPALRCTMASSKEES